MKESILFQNIVEELKQIPDSYWNGIYELLHNIRENLTPTKKEESEVFDWDDLIDDIHLNRNRSNQAMSSLTKTLT